MRKRRSIAIVGGGIAGVAAAWELAQSDQGETDFTVTLFEASDRLGGIVETVREAGFTIECGPDGWVTEKPWARQLAEELGLGGEIIASNDATRKTYILLRDGPGSHSAESAPRAAGQRLVSMPDNLRMMVPSGLAALTALEAQQGAAADSLFSPAAIAAYHDEVARAEELKATAPIADESVASFIRRHFGDEVLEKIGAPLLSGVFGGDVARLSVRAVMAPFVAMEREYGSLILALEARHTAGHAARDAAKVAARVAQEVIEKAPTQVAQAIAQPNDQKIGIESAEAYPEPAVFTTLRSGLGTLIDWMVAGITANPAITVRFEAPVTAMTRVADGWRLETRAGIYDFDCVLLATPVDVAQRLLAQVDAEAAALMQMDASSAVVVAFAFTADAAERLSVPPGFGFLNPPSHEAEHEANSLLAATFVDQKFPGRVPEGGRLLRAFFGGATADRLLEWTDDAIATLAWRELAVALAIAASEAHRFAPTVTVVRRWPRALPQYAVGHLERMAALDRRIAAIGRLWLLGNGYRGVGLPDLVRDARAAARAAFER